MNGIIDCKRTNYITSIRLLVVICLTMVALQSQAQTPPAPTYSVSVGSGSFSPKSMCNGMTATASLTGSLNVQNPNQEIQESGDSWGWSPVVTGYAATSQSAFGAVPSGIIPPSVSATPGSAKTTVSATADQTTSPGYYQVTVTGTDRFTLTDSSTNPPTVTSQSKSGSTTLNITVVTLGSIQYKDPQSGWIACPSPLYVMKGTSVQFKAIPSPSDASFPSGNPTWGGTSGVSGTGATTNATFSTQSASVGDTKTVTATCGNTASTDVVVYTLQPAFSPEDFFAGRSLSQYGLGEVIYLSFSAIPAVPASNIGGLQWFLNSGSGALTSATNGTGTFTCGATPGSPDLELTVVSGPSAGQSVPANISVIAPSNAYAVRVSGIEHQQNWVSIGIQLEAYYLPKTVSFGNLQWKESDVAASTATGFFLDSRNGLPDTNHHAATAWLGADSGDADLGTFIGMKDTAEFDLPHWDNGGTLVWPIPWNYRVVMPGGTVSSPCQFTTATQSMSGDQYGTATISKKGIGPFSKTAASAWSNF